MLRSLYDIGPLVTFIEQGYTILTPNQRLARRVTVEWNRYRAARGDRVWESVFAVPVQAWLEQQWQRYVMSGQLAPAYCLSTEQSLQLWRQVISEIGAEQSSLALLRPDSAADLAASARDTMLQWRSRITEGPWRAYCEHDPDCSAFLSWLERFESRLQAEGCLTSADCLAQLSGLDQPATSTRVALLECGDLPPLYESALSHLCGEIRPVVAGEEVAERFIYPVENHAEELRAVADWARARYLEDPELSIGILLTDMTGDRIPLEHQLRRAFDCLGEQYASLPINFSTGIPLANTPVVRDALLALEFVKHRTSVPSVVRLLNSRYLGMADVDSALAHRFVVSLHDDGVEDISTAALRVGASEVKLGEEEGLELAVILMKLARLRHLKSKALPGIWATHFQEVLDIWGWPGTAALDSLEYQQVKLWFELLASLRAYDAVCPPMGYEEALALLQEAARKQMSQPETADSNIQVLGPLEAVGLQFDHLWLVGMQASRWPEPPRPSPFLPMAMQAELGMPRATAQREWEVASARIAQYSRSVKTLHASYCHEIDGVAEAPSPLLDDFTEACLAESEKLPAQWVAMWRARKLETIEDSQAPAVDLDNADANSGGSGLLEDQAQCPFRAFARRRLQVAPLGEFGIALSPAERGAIVHDALYALWGRVVDHARLVTLEEKELAQLVAESAHLGLSRVRTQRQGALASTYWSLERSRLERLLQEWLAVERTRAEFVVRAREQKVSLEIARLRLEMRIDRIDTLADGSQVIMDYKSSASSIKEWMGSRPAKPQLLLYGIAAPGENAGLAFAQLRPRDCKFVGLGVSKFAPGIEDDIAKAAGSHMPVETWAQLNEQWADTLHKLAQAYVDGLAPVDPLSASSCTWCGLQSLCRINATGAAFVDSAPEHDERQLGNDPWE